MPRLGEGWAEVGVGGWPGWWGAGGHSAAVFECALHSFAKARTRQQPKNHLIGTMKDEYVRSDSSTSVLHKVKR